MQFEPATWAGYGNGGDIYDPRDAVPAAARYLRANGAPHDPRAAIYTYNHSGAYVADVLAWAHRYATRFPATVAPTTRCTPTAPTVPDKIAGQVLAYARAQLGKPYIWGGVGPVGYDCSGLAMMAYRTAGITIPRLANDQYFDEPHITGGREQPGDLVFFAGSDGTLTDPGHVGIVTAPARHLMIVAPHTGTDIQVQNYTTVGQVDGFVGFARPRP
jgi:cell wall-associated NlpC family hydrolase